MTSPKEKEKEDAELKIDDLIAEPKDDKVERKVPEVYELPEILRKFNVPKRTYGF